MGTFFRLESVTMGVLAFALTVSVAIPSARAEDVKMFNSAPSVDELERALGTGAGVPKHKTRSIVLDGALNAAPTPEPVVQPSAVPQFPAAQPYAASQPQYAPTQYAAPQYASPAAAPSVGSTGKAVGFPIKFNVSSAAVRQDAVPFLQSIGGLLQKDSSIRLIVEGHTDSSGDYRRNLDLSRARAASVVNFLVTQYNIDPSRLQSVGKGPTEPLSSDSSDPSNRRVQFRVLG